MCFGIGKLAFTLLSDTLLGGNVGILFWSKWPAIILLPSPLLPREIMRDWKTPSLALDRQQDDQPTTYARIIRATKEFFQNNCCNWLAWDGLYPATTSPIFSGVWVVCCSKWDCIVFVQVFKRNNSREVERRQFSFQDFLVLWKTRTNIKSLTIFCCSDLNLLSKNLTTSRE